MRDGIRLHAILFETPKSKLLVFIQHRSTDTSRHFAMKKFLCFYMLGNTFISKYAKKIMRLRLE